MARGRSGRSSWRIPRAIAPLVTITTASPAVWCAATVAHTRSRTSRRNSPDSSATMLDPSLSTNVDMAGLSLGRAGAGQRTRTVSASEKLPPRPRAGGAMLRVEPTRRCASTRGRGGCVLDSLKRADRWKVSEKAVAAPPSERRARVQLEHRAGYLHVVAGLEAGVLQCADH